MTIKTCESKLKAAKTPEEKEFWQNRINRKMRHMKYAHLRKEPEVDDGKKPKR